MTIVRACALLFLFFVVPIMIGRLITYRAKSGFIADYLIGFFGNLAIFYILYSFVEWIQNWTTFNEIVTGGFTLLIKLYAATCAILIIIWAVLDRASIKTVLTVIQSKKKSFLEKISSDRFIIIYLFIFLAILLFQLYMAFAYEINEWSYDDYDYVVTSKDTITSDTLSYVNFIDGSMPVVAEKRAVASWGTYVAMLSKVSGFEVTTVYHTILPVFLLLMAYINFYYVSTFLFKDIDERIIFLIILSITYIFGLYSHYSMTFRLLGALWQGKAVLTVIAIPFFILYMINVYKCDTSRRYIFPIASLSLGICTFTSLSLMFVPLTAVLIWVMMCVYHRHVYAISYLLASLFGPAYVGIFYILIWMLQQDMQGREYKYFEFRKVTNRWEKWFR